MTYAPRTLHLNAATFHPDEMRIPAALQQARVPAPAHRRPGRVAVALAGLRRSSR